MHLIDEALLKERATAPYSSVPRPFLKWAGSKRHMLKDMCEFIPLEFNTYYEPFLGSGSLFFLLHPKQAVLNDACHDLIKVYQAVKDNVSAVWKYVSPLKPEKELYYEIRENMSAGKYKRAAQFIYLNKSCWNGLYRVNSSGKFNVPFGKPRSDYIADFKNLSACASCLDQDEVILKSGDFERAVENAGDGDFVFFDPPYVTSHGDNGFVDYNEVLFSWEDQVRLASVAEKLRKKGVNVLITNAAHPSVRVLYPHFQEYHIDRHSTLASTKSKRRKVREAIFIG